MCLCLCAGRRSSIFLFLLCLSQRLPLLFVASSVATCCCYFHISTQYTHKLRTHTHLYTIDFVYAYMSIVMLLVSVMHRVLFMFALCTCFVRPVLRSCGLCVLGFRRHPTILPLLPCTMARRC